MVFYFRDNIVLEINTPLNCQHAVLDTVNAIQENIDHNVFSCGIFLDFKKAFETVGMLLIPGTGNGERRTRNGERGTGNGERGTGNGERGTGNREPGTGVREQMYSGNPLESSKWRSRQKKRLKEKQSGLR